MNVAGVSFHATALQKVANDLQKSIDKAKKPTVGSELDWQKWVLGYVSSTLILRALATEQMLKVLSYMKTGNYRTDGKAGHDLLVLFDELDDPTRQLIDDLAETHGIRPLAQILEKHRNDFANFRYIMTEDGQTHADLQDLDKAFSILTAVSKGEKFRRLCASGKET